MKLQYLMAKIKTYEGNAQRQKKKADQFYAKYKSSNSQDDYRQAQYYYSESEKSLNILEEYKRKLANKDYEK